MRLSNGERVVYSILKNNSTITNIVGDRIFPIIPTQDSNFPLVTYNRIGFELENQLQGNSDLAHTTIQIDWWCNTAADLQSLGDAIFSALAFWNGSMEGITVRVLTIDDSTVVQDDQFFHANLTVSVYHD